MIIEYIVTHIYMFICCNGLLVVVAYSDSFGVHKGTNTNSTYRIS
jgi:hypothetical protein